MQDLTFRAILFLLFIRIKWIILAVVVGAVTVGAYAQFALPEEYTSSAMLYVVNLEDGADSQAATSSNLSASERLVKIVRTATTAPWALQEASNRLNNALTSSQLSGALDFSLVSETSFLKVQVTHTDPELAQRACDVLAETAVVAFAATGEKGTARIYQPAVKATKSAPDVPRLAVTGALVGFVLSIVIIVSATIFSVTVYDKDDVQRRLNIPVLGEIPSFKVPTKGGKR